MKLFAMRDLKGAYAYSNSGGQSLHLMCHSGGIYPNAPTCFRGTKEFGHLFDLNEERLVTTARRLGVRQVVVSRRGTTSQHVDLCGRPLEMAKALCERDREGLSSETF